MSEFLVLQHCFQPIPFIILSCLEMFHMFKSNLCCCMWEKIKVIFYLKTNLDFHSGYVPICILYQVLHDAQRERITL